MPRVASDAPLAGRAGQLRECGVPNVGFWLSIAVSSIRVSGAGGCPSPEEVQQHLDALVGTKVSGWSATLADSPEGLDLALAQLLDLLRMMPLPLPD